jgi:S1-C subfamily serine protease
MKKTIFAGLGIFALAFVGVTAALQWDRSSAAARIRQASLATDAPIGMPVQAGGAVGAVDFRAAAKALLPSVVSIDNLRMQRAMFGEPMLVKAGSGSGVVIDAEGYILTNHHVVQGSAELQVKLADGRTIAGKLVGSDPRSDLALVKVEATGLKAAPIGDSKGLEQGQWVLAVGSPLGYENTVSVGVVSATGRILKTPSTPLIDAIQTDAAINPGNSGGALATADGKLVGINTAILSQSGGSIGLGFAIPMHRAQQVVDDILKFGRARYGWMGVELADDVLPSPRNRAILQRQLETTAEFPQSGLIIMNIGQGVPAAQAGLKRFDVVMEAEGKKLADWSEFQVVLLSKKPGDMLKLKVWSAGRARDVTVTLGDEPI